MSIYLGDTILSGVATPIEPTRNVGQIIQSTLPITDAGLHLLDGSSVLGGGSYDAFVEFIGDLYTAGTSPECFCTEAEWQTSVTNYGSCYKYVYTAANGNTPASVRLPKATTEHGALIKSYSSGTDWYRIYQDGWCEQGGVASSSDDITFLKEFKDTNYSSLATWQVTSSLYETSLTIYSKTTATISFRIGYYNMSLTSFSGRDFDWQACGYIDISDYQFYPVYEYVVIATSVKTQIEVDIDEIATDLNGKADVDLSNVTSTGKETVVGWGMPDYSAGIDITSYNSANNKFTAPCDGIITVAYLSTNTSAYLPYINNLQFGSYNQSAIVNHITQPINKWDTFFCTGIHSQVGSGCNKFYPFKGVN